MAIKTLTDAEKSAREVDMFGCSAVSIIEAMRSPITAISGPEMLAMNILSDAQELLAQDCEQNAEQVRQYINRAKFVLDSVIRAKGVR